jgi:hypothetical protein
MLKEEVVYERWDNGAKVEMRKPKKLHPRELTKEEVLEIKTLIEELIARRGDSERS